MRCGHPSSICRHTARQLQLQAAPCYHQAHPLQPFILKSPGLHSNDPQIASEVLLISVQNNWTWDETFRQAAPAQRECNPMTSARQPKKTCKFAMQLSINLSSKLREKIFNQL
ncbi:MAG: hypothetical protein Q4A11_05325 [Brachymonas sp.]|nr:hypothetical protein [Brachymonas sp.]